MARKYALVLSGGGFYGSFEIGALEYIKEHGIPHADGSVYKDFKFQITAGVSVGALNAGLMAQNDWEKLRKLWADVRDIGPQEISVSDIINHEDGSFNIKNLLLKIIPPLNFWKILGAIFSKKYRDKLVGEAEQNFRNLKGLASNAPLKKKIQENFSPSRVPAGNIFRMGYTCALDAEYKTHKSDGLASDEDFHNAVLASTSIPVIWAPVTVIQDAEGNVNLTNVDGGFREMSPMGDIIDDINTDPWSDDPNNEYYVVIINCYNGKLPIDEHFTDPSQYDLTELGPRAFMNTPFSQIIKDNINQFLRVNDLVEQAAAQGVTLYKRDLEGNVKLDAQGKPIPLRRYKSIVIQPTPDDITAMGSPLVANKAAIQLRWDLGKKRAAEAFAQLPKSWD